MRLQPPPALEVDSTASSSSSCWAVMSYPPPSRPAQRTFANDPPLSRPNPIISAPRSVSTESTQGTHTHTQTDIHTIPVFEDDLIVGKQQLTHDVRILPVQPEGPLCRGHDPAFL